MDLPPSWWSKADADGGQQLGKYNITVNHHYPLDPDVSLTIAAGMLSTEWLRDTLCHPRGLVIARAWLSSRDDRMSHISYKAGFALYQRMWAINNRQTVFPPCSACGLMTKGSCSKILGFGMNPRICGGVICATCQLQETSPYCLSCRGVFPWPALV